MIIRPTNTALRGTPTAPPAGRPGRVRRVRAAAWAAVGVLLGTSSGGRADDNPYSDFLVGERSLGMAGAFVAVADDALTTFHNPAGIGQLSTAALSGSLWAVTLAYHTVTDGYATDLGEANLAHSEEPSLPLNLAAVVKFGHPDPDGIRPHGLGATVISPHRLDYRFTAQLDGTRPSSGADAVDRIEVRRRDRVRWYGASYAYRLSPEFSLGLSAFLSDRAFRHEEVEIRASDPAMDGTPGASSSRTSLVDADTQHGVIRLGALWRASRHWQLGVMVQPPGIRLDFDSVVQSVNTINGGSGFETYSQSGATVNLPIPWELRMGISWLAIPHRLLTLDLALTGPAGSADNPLPLLARAPTDPSPGAFVPQETRRLVGFRGALGYEVIINNIMPIRGGVMFESSSRPDIPTTSDIYVSDDLRSVGVALSFGVWTEGYEISFGTTAVFRRGDGLGLVRSDDPTQPEYRQTAVRDGAVFFFVAGGSRAVETLVKRIGMQKRGESADPADEP